MNAPRAAGFLGLVTLLVSATARPLLWGAAQDPTFRALADPVRVDVVVTDKSGQPVHGLTKDDFELRDDGKVVPIATFAEERHDAKAGALTSVRIPHVREDVVDNRGASASHLVVLFIDDTHIWTGRTDLVKSIARQAIEKLGPNASMALLFSGGEHDVEVTQDPALLLAGLDQFKGRKLVRRPFDAQDCPSPRRCDDLQDFFNDLGAYKRLSEAAQFVADARSERKAFIFISESSGRELTGLFETGTPLPTVMPDNPLFHPGAMGVTTTSNKTDAVPLATDPYGPDKAYDYAGFDLVAMMSALQRSNVSVYSIDPRGYVPTEKLLYECFPVEGVPDPCMGDDFLGWVRRAQHSLEHISDASGGFAVVNTDDFTGGLGRIMDDLDNYYLLGFVPKPAKVNAYRPLNVRVTKPGLTVRYRHGYDPSGPPREKNADPLAVLSSSVLPAIDLPLRMTSTILPTGGRDAQVVFTLEVSSSVAALSGSDRRVRDTLRYLIVGADLKSKKVTAHIERDAKIVLAPDATSAAGRNSDHLDYAIVTSMTLPPGSYQIRSSAASAGLKIGGSVYEAVSVPDFTKVPLALGGVVVARVGPARVPVAESTLAKGALPFSPTLDRVFSISDELQLLVPIAGVDDSATTARIDVCDLDGQSVRGTDVPVGAERRLADIGVRRVMVTDRHVRTNLSLRDLPTGNYRIKVTAHTLRNTAQSEIAIRVQ